MNDSKKVDLHLRSEYSPTNKIVQWRNALHDVRWNILFRHQFDMATLPQEQKVSSLIVSYASSWFIGTLVLIVLILIDFRPFDFWSRAAAVWGCNGQRPYRIRTHVSRARVTYVERNDPLENNHCVRVDVAAAREASPLWRPWLGPSFASNYVHYTSIRGLWSLPAH